jgi:hypothetical protein
MNGNAIVSDVALATIPIGLLFFLIAFGVTLFVWQARSKKDRGSETKDHSERIYKDFDMYLKVMLAIVGAAGYVRLTQFGSDPNTARQALVYLGALSLFVMTIFAIFVLCHQGSKIRRWTEIEWAKAVFWQELWACFAMWLFSSAVWWVANVW